MADLMETLMADPKFLSGLTLLGGANPRNAPLQQAAAMMMQMNQAKQKQANDKIKLEQETMQTQLYGQQIEQSKAKLAHDIKTQEQQDRIMAQGMEMLKSSGYLGGVGQPQQPQQPPAQNMEQPQGMPPQGMQPGQPPAPQGQQQPKPPQAAHLDFFDQRIPKQESGGRQFDQKTGMPITSPKGAVGIAQVMPSTAPEAAQLAGMEWKPDVFNRRMTGDPTLDAETMNYNRVLGKAYFDKQFKDFGGRIDYASAAYNAGPQRVQTAIATAEKAKHPDIWTAFLPPETQKYLKETGALQPSTPAQPPPPPVTPLGLRNPPNPRIGLAIMGGLAQGPKGFSDIAKALEPQYARPGSIQIEPNGDTKTLPDVIGERRVAVDEANLKLKQRETDYKTGTSNVPGMSPEGKSNMTEKVLMSQRKLLEDTYTKLQPIPEQLSSIAQARVNLAQAGPFVGSMAESKLAMAKLINNNLGSFGVSVKPEEVGNAEALRLSLLTPVLTMLKQVDSTPSESQQRILMAAVGSLGTDPGGLTKILDILEQRLKEKVNVHNKKVDEVSRYVPFSSDLKIDTTKIPEPLGKQTTIPAGWTVKVK